VLSDQAILDEKLAHGGCPVKWRMPGDGDPMRIPNPHRIQHRIRIPQRIQIPMRIQVWVQNGEARFQSGPWGTLFHEKQQSGGLCLDSAACDAVAHF